MDANLLWILHECTVPTLKQGAMIAAPVLISGAVVRFCVVTRLPEQITHALVIMMGLFLLWFFYSTGIVYFLVLCGLVYVILVTIQKNKGIVIASTSVAFILICEMYIASPFEWHQVRGSFLVMAMKMVSLGFDMEPRIAKGGEKRPPEVPQCPSLVVYLGYCLFPSTSIFGPFMVFSEHMKFLNPSPMSISWLWSIIRAWLGSMLCLAVSSCFMPFLFNEPKWNKWLAAYAAAASFRYSHYFVSLLSQSGALSSGIGKNEQNEWSKFHVVHPVAIELPRSLGSVVTNWNLPMHVFLKNYVYLPSRTHIGRFGAILATYLASALLHGLNFQLGAVLLSIGIYAYIENVLRHKLSMKLDACILDRPCSGECSHTHKQTSPLAVLLNAAFALLAVYHLAYLGVMFGSQSPEERKLELQGFSMTHTLKKWAHLDFLSHWIALATYILHIIL